MSIPIGEAAGFAMRAQSVSAAEQLRRTTTTAGAKLQQAARDFESILLASWLEKMQETLSTIPGGDADPAHENLRSLGVQTLASGIVDAGGIGIAQVILRDFEQGRTSAVTSPTIKSRAVAADQDIEAPRS
ncbi:MAG TPA: hypothetical protein VN622_12595 [Clostridia bacterium]|nr:hypothetical protein [Clostridia bacterium]